MDNSTGYVSHSAGTSGEALEKDDSSRGYMEQTVEEQQWTQTSEKEDDIFEEDLLQREFYQSEHFKNEQTPNSYLTYTGSSADNITETQTNDESDVTESKRFLGDTKPLVSDVTDIAIGEFGVWQFKISLLMSLLKLSSAWYQLNIIFMAPPQEFWCAKPKSFDKYSDKEWRDLCKPVIEEHPCLIFDPDFLRQSSYWSRTSIPLVKCRKFVYDTSVFKRTIVSDWDLVCDRHSLTHLTQCIMMWGVLLGTLIFGYIADKYGRRNPLMAAIVIQCIASYVTAFMTSYQLFLVSWFLLALASGGISIISFVFCIEAVSGKWRTIIPVLYQIPFGLGNSVMAAYAYMLRDWRKLELALAVTSTLYTLYWFIVPESPRWLLANGQTKQAFDVLEKIAKENERKWDPKKLKMLLPKDSGKKEKPSFMAFLKSKNMRLKTALLSLSWFCTGLSFFTFSQFLAGIGSDIFFTVSMTGIISTVGPLVCVSVITRLGRKATTWLFQFLTATCFVAILLIPTDRFKMDWPRLLFAGIGFAGMAAFTPTLYLYSGELFPTLGRNVGVGGVTNFARIGSMIAPMIISLDYIFPDLPLMLLVVLSFGQMLLLIPLPETKGTRLPDTLEQAEKITKSQNNGTTLSVNQSVS